MSKKSSYNTLNLLKNDNDQMQLCISCMVCGEPVPLTSEEKICLDYGHSIGPKICPKCCNAILSIRSALEFIENSSKKPLGD